LRGTEGLNPSPSSGESANRQSLARDPGNPDYALPTAINLHNVLRPVPISSAARWDGKASTGS
jgi:hypothetical protein